MKKKELKFRSFQTTRSQIEKKKKKLRAHSRDVVSVWCIDVIITVPISSDQFRKSHTHVYLFRPKTM